MLSSSGNLTDLIPLLGSLFTKNTEPKSDATTDETDGEKKTSDYFTPIKNVAPTDVEETLFEYTTSV